MYLVDSGAVELARELDGLPLALSTAGAYLDNIATTFADYLKTYRDSWLRLQQTSPRLLTYEDRALYSTWDISYAQVDQKSANSAMLLRLWAYFDSEDLWFELLRGGRRTGPAWLRELTDDSVTFNDAVRVLCNYGFASAHITGEEGCSSGPRGYSMHNCVHKWTAHVLNSEWYAEMARLALQCVGAHIPAETQPEYWLTQRRLLRHANRCLAMQLAREGSRPEEDTGVFHGLGDLFTSQSQLGDAEIVYGWALEGRLKALGSEHPLTLATVHALGFLYKYQGRMQDARSMYDRALRGREKILGVDHISTLETVNNLGYLCKDQGHLADAEALYLRALHGRTRVLGPDHISTLQTVSALGNLYVTLGQLQQAKEMYDRALQGRETALGREHISTLKTVQSLGNLYKNLGQIQIAEAMYLRALDGREKAFGQDHLSTLNTVNNLGLLYADQGRLDDAEAMHNRAFRGYKRALGLAHMWTLDSASNRGLLYRSQGRLGEAKGMFDLALGGKEKVLGPYHRSTLDTINNIGLLYMDQGQFNNAESMFERALQGYEKALGTERICKSIGALNSLENLANLYAQTRRFDQARAAYIECRVRVGPLFGVQHVRYQILGEKINSLQYGCQ